MPRKKSQTFLTEGYTISAIYLYMTSGVGGARQYIHSIFPVQKSRREHLSQRLEKLVPELPTETYQIAYPLTACLSGFLTYMNLLFPYWT